MQPTWCHLFRLGGDYRFWGDSQPNPAQGGAWEGLQERILDCTDSKKDPMMFWQTAPGLRMLWLDMPQGPLGSLGDVAGLTALKLT